ncbi:hypothetical protein [Streptomyces sp. NPDC088915]|uniref:hypothetical protein n=1 Tax=Streptomyces sp. NPDC088915 TaxID=3365912 RepID=UPI0037F5E085
MEVLASVRETRVVPSPRNHETAPYGVALRPGPATADREVRLPTARSSRFSITAGTDSAAQANRTAGTLLRTLFFRGPSTPNATVTGQRALLCLAELAGVAATRQPAGTSLWCQLWMDDEHVFVAVEEDATPPASARVRVLEVSRRLADDSGSHELPDGFQSWAAVRRLDRTG